MFEVVKASGVSGSATANIALKSNTAIFESQNIHCSHVSPGYEKCKMRSVSSSKVG